MHRRFWILAAVLSTVAVACSSTNVLDQAKLRGLIETDLAEDIGLPLTNVSCPEVKDPVDGTTFECTVTVDGQTLRITGVVTDAKTGFVEVENADAILQTEVLETTIAEDFTEQLGFEVTVDCGDTQVIVKAPGEELTCVATDDTGEPADVMVEVLDAEGRVNYELV